MKTILSFLAVIFSAIFYAQEYSPMLNENNEWVSTLYIYDFDNSYMVNYDHHFRLSDNVMIFNDKEYIEIEYKKRKRIDNTVVQYWTEWQSGGFYVFENAMEKKVYVYYSENNFLLHESGEFLLYNFNQEVGDLVDLTGFAEGWIDPVEILYIVDEEWFGEMRKTYILDLPIYDVEFKIIEGVGSSHGLNTMLNMTDSGWVLRNFGQNLSTTEMNSSKIKIYPNPFTNQIQIDTEKPIQQLQLFETTGKLISSKSTISELNSNLSQLKPGVYILTITYKDHQKETVKLLKK